jgi:hypothetical protein
MKAPRPPITFEIPVEHQYDRYPDARERRELRDRIDQINADLTRIGRPHRIGRLWRLERNHYFGIMAIYGMVPATQETIH